MESLSKCLCGSEEVIFYETIDNFKTGISCQECGRSTGAFYTKTEAIHRWINNIDIEIISPISKEEIIKLIDGWHTDLKCLQDRIIGGDNEIIDKFKKFAKDVIQYVDDLNF